MQGAGAVGVEMAGEIKNHHPNHSVTLVHSRSQVLSNEPLPDDFKDRALEVLREEGVEVLLNERPSVDLDAKELVFADGREVNPGFVLMAASKCIPGTMYLPDSALDEEGYVRVSATLTLASEDSKNPTHFAIGDIARVSGIKRAGAALRMGCVAAINIYAAMLAQEGLTEEPAYNDWPEVPPMIALAVGKQALTFGPGQGTKWGVDVMEQTFGDDLGWTFSLRYLNLLDYYEPLKAHEPVGPDVMPGR